MKIKTLAVANTAFLHLKGPDGAHLYEGEGDDRQKVGIDLFGPGSPEYGQIESKQSTRFTKNMQENDGKFVPGSVEERRKLAAEDLAALTASFHHIEADGPDSKPLKGVELYIDVYSDPKLGWIKEQALKFIADWGKFTPA